HLPTTSMPSTVITMEAVVSSIIGTGGDVQDDRSATVSRHCQNEASLAFLSCENYPDIRRAHSVPVGYGTHSEKITAFWQPPWQMAERRQDITRITSSLNIETSTAITHHPLIVAPILRSTV